VVPAASPVSVSAQFVPLIVPLQVPLPMAVKLVHEDPVQRRTV
jgi:hypothetical protein